MKMKRAAIVWSSYTVLILAVVGMAMLQGCSTLGYDNVDTTRKAIVVANAEVRAANLLLQDLIARRAISRGQAQETLDNLVNAKNMLQLALNTVDANGDPATAESNLQRANITLSVALALLAPLVEE